MLEPMDMNTTPPGGWRYTEQANGLQFKHNDIKALLKMIRESRVANGLPVHGDWVQQVYHQICIQNPQTKCEDKMNPDRVWLPEDIWRFITTLSEMADQGALMVDQDEQMRRINICATCPKNGIVACRWCGPLAEMLTRFIADRNIPKVAEVYKRACLACGCSLESKTAYQMNVLKELDSRLGTNPAYPNNCWMVDKSPICVPTR